MEKSVHSGHRQRMRRKLSDYSARVFDTYELLEMLLYNTVPVRDTNPIAKALLWRFGSLEGVFSASKSELIQIDGIGERTAELICTVAEALYLSFDENGSESKIFESYDELGKYITEYFDKTKDNKVIMLLFDNRMKLIDVHDLYDFDYASGGVKPATFINVALKRRASVAVIAHNHPYGTVYPSEGDVQTNALIKDSLYSVGVMLAEHYIVCGDRYLGFMEHIDRAFAQKPALDKFVRSKRIVR